MIAGNVFAECVAMGSLKDKVYHLLTEYYEHVVNGVGHIYLTTKAGLKLQADFTYDGYVECEIEYEKYNERVPIEIDPQIADPADFVLRQILLCFRPDRNPGNLPFKQDHPMDESDPASMLWKTKWNGVEFKRIGSGYTGAVFSDAARRYAIKILFQEKDPSMELYMLDNFTKLDYENSPCPVCLIKTDDGKFTGILMTYAGETLHDRVESLSNYESFLLILQFLYVVVCVSDKMLMNKVTDKDVCVWQRGPAIRLKVIDCGEWETVDEGGDDPHYNTWRKHCTFVLDLVNKLPKPRETHRFSLAVTAFHDALDEIDDDSLHDDLGWCRKVGMEIIENLARSAVKCVEDMVHQDESEHFRYLLEALAVQLKIMEKLDALKRTAWGMMRRPEIKSVGTVKYQGNVYREIGSGVEGSVFMDDQGVSVIKILYEEGDLKLYYEILSELTRLVPEYSPFPVQKIKVDGGEYAGVYMGNAGETVRDMRSKLNLAERLLMVMQVGYVVLKVSDRIQMDDIHSKNVCVWHRGPGVRMRLVDCGYFALVDGRREIDLYTWQRNAWSMIDFVRMFMYGKDQLKQSAKRFEMELMEIQKRVTAQNEGAQDQHETTMLREDFMMVVRILCEDALKLLMMYLKGEGKTETVTDVLYLQEGEGVMRKLRELCMDVRSYRDWLAVAMDKKEYRLEVLKRDDPRNGSAMKSVNEDLALIMDRMKWCERNFGR